MAHLELFKKLKRFNPLEPSPGVVGLSFLALFFLACFFCLDYRSVSHGVRLVGQPGKIHWLKLDGRADERPGFLDENGDGCDLFDGSWVWDESHPLYQSKDCSLMDDGFRCSENGRPDSFYTKWRWQPKNCNLPRFDANKMLNSLRNHRVSFVGDSIGRNQWESLLCMLSSAVPDKKSIYEVNGNLITKHTGFLAFKFKDFDCTVEYYRAPFLVLQSRKPAGAPENVKTTLKLDKMDWSSNNWRDADIIVFNTGHWWNNEKTIRMGCYFQEGEEVKMEMSVESAYQRSIETVIDWIGSNVNMNRTRVFFRTFAPVHFRGGDWRNGGSCHLEKLPDLSSFPGPYQTYIHFKIFTDVISSRVDKLHSKKMNLLNVTYMTSLRKDAHPSLYYLGPEIGLAPLHRQDCSHWCLPGVPDSWNELFYALLLKQQSVQLRNSTNSTNSTQA